MRESKATRPGNSQAILIIITIMITIIIIIIIVFSSDISSRWSACSPMSPLGRT